jgi:hypothetical protein
MFISGLFVNEVQDDIYNYGDHNAYNYEGNDGKIEREIISFDNDVTRQLSQERDVVTEDKQQSQYYYYSADY